MGLGLARLLGAFPAALVGLWGGARGRGAYLICSLLSIRCTLSASIPMGYQASARTSSALGNPGGCPGGAVLGAALGNPGGCPGGCPGQSWGLRLSATLYRENLRITTNQ